MNNTLRTKEYTLQILIVQIEKAKINNQVELLKSLNLKYENELVGYEDLTNEYLKKYL